MEPEGSLPQLQMPATCPYPDPARSIPYTHIQLPEANFVSLFRCLDRIRLSVQVQGLLFDYFSTQYVFMVKSC
jgi:hypothetical protein